MVIKIMKRKGKAGVLYRTSAPKTGVVNPHNVKSIITNETQNQNQGKVCVENF